MTTSTLAIAMLPPLLRDESGATAIEYALIAAGIAVVIVAAVSARSVRRSKGSFISSVAGLQLTSHRPVFSPAGISAVPSASASRACAEPGRSGFCWLSCGAQPDSQMISNVARTLPSRIGEALRVDLRHALQRRAPQRRAAALGQRIGRAHAAQLAHQDERRGDSARSAARRRSPAARSRRAAAARPSRARRRTARRAARRRLRSRLRRRRRPGAVRSACRRRAARRGTARRA